MRAIPVDNLPKRRTRHRLQDFIADFIKCEAKVVKIEFSERDYKSAKVCRNCLDVAAKSSGYSIRACIRDGQVFLVKV